MAKSTLIEVEALVDVHTNLINTVEHTVEHNAT